MKRIDSHWLHESGDNYLDARRTHAATRDALIAAQHEFHELILGVKSQVKAIYGPDSDELAALGLKKKSERKGRGKAARIQTINSDSNTENLK